MSTGYETSDNELDSHEKDPDAKLEKPKESREEFEATKDLDRLTIDPEEDLEMKGEIEESETLERSFTELIDESAAALEFEQAEGEGDESFEALRDPFITSLDGEPIATQSTTEENQAEPHLDESESLDAPIVIDPSRETVQATVDSDGDGLSNATEITEELVDEIADLDSSAEDEFGVPLIEKAEGTKDILWGETDEFFGSEPAILAVDEPMDAEFDDIGSGETESSKETKPAKTPEEDSKFKSTIPGGESGPGMGFPDTTKIPTDETNAETPSVTTTAETELEVQIAKDDLIRELPSKEEVLHQDMDVEPDPGETTPALTDFDLDEDRSITEEVERNDPEESTTTAPFIPGSTVVSSAVSSKSGLKKDTENGSAG